MIFFDTADIANSLKIIENLWFSYDFARSAKAVRTPEISAKMLPNCTPSDPNSGSKTESETDVGSILACGRVLGPSGDPKWLQNRSKRGPKSGPGDDLRERHEKAPKRLQKRACRLHAPAAPPPAPPLRGCRHGNNGSHAKGALSVILVCLKPSKPSILGRGLPLPYPSPPGVTQLTFCLRRHSGYAWCFCRARLANRFGVHFGDHVGPIVGLNLGPNNDQQTGESFRPFLKTFWDQF